MKKFYEIGLRSGLKGREIGRVARFGLFGLIAAGLAGLSGCFKNARQAPEAPVPAAPKEGAQVKPPALQDLVDDIKERADADGSDTKDNCGPYPGYPCGTRYYTVSASDFAGIKRLQR